MTFYYLHGFASGPESFKAQFFKQEILRTYKSELIIPDLNTPTFENMTLEIPIKCYKISTQQS